MAQEKISVAEMAKRLNCSISNITYLLRARVIAGQKTKSGWNVSRADFEAYIKDYISIMEAEANIASMEKELEAKKKEIKASLKHNKTMEWLLVETVKQLNRIFINNTKRYFDIESLYQEGMTSIIDEKQKEWCLSRERTLQIINKEIRRLVQMIRNMPKLTELQEENKALKTRIEVKQMVIDNLKEKLNFYYNIGAEIKDDEILAKRIFDIEEFSIRTINACMSCGIKTVSQLCQMTKYDLLKIRNFGGKSLIEVEDWLKKHGLQLQSRKPMQEKYKYQVRLRP